MSAKANGSSAFRTCGGAGGGGRDSRGLDIAGGMSIMFLSVCRGGSYFFYCGREDRWTLKN